MYERFTDRARKLMHLANQEAMRFNHEYIEPSDILLGLICEEAGVAAHVLKSLGIGRDRVRKEIDVLAQSPPPSGADRLIGKQLQTTPPARHVIGFAIAEARSLGHNYVGTEHILLGLLRVEDDVVAQVLTNLRARPDLVRAEVLETVGQSIT